MQKIHVVSARELAEFACEHGSLSATQQSARRMRDGIKGHQAIQNALPEGWQTEVPISKDLSVDGVCFRVQGRADALCLQEGSVAVLEIKTTGGSPAMILSDDYPEHWAQAEIYAWLFCTANDAWRAKVTLIYANLDGRRREYSREYDLETLEARFLRYAKVYAAWLKLTDEWKERSEPTLTALPFPFETYREGQHDMAAAVYLAMKQHTRALIEAPTGIGKTAAAMFGALKALGEGHITAVFYLTARTTGRRAAEDALDRMRGCGLILRSVTITAKDKCCLLGERDCMACPYALNYYDRRREALREALNLQKLDAEAIEALARRHELCPFELSLDISESADVIICDYNYVFDPRVRLKRYFDTKSKAGLLIDEAHNLPDRARSMLSAELSGKAIAELRKTVKGFEGAESPMCAALTTLLAAFKTEETEPACESVLPHKIAETVEIFNTEVEDLEPTEKALVDFLFEAQWFAKVAAQFKEDSYRALIFPEGKTCSVRLWCFNPSVRIDKLFSRVGGAALFSATVAPLDFYGRQMAVLPNKGDTLLRLESPFPTENLFVGRVPVAVSFKDRERTLNAVCQVLHTMTQAHTGNYICCFPSYAYLMQAYGYYRMLFPEERVLRQEANMDETTRAAFIDRFHPAPKRGLLAFIVLGSVFAEGIDLPGDRLSGAAIVTTGMPQPDFESEMLCTLYNDAFEEGFDAVYVYSGLRRVLQAGGRVIRSENDRGVILLLDTRYRQEKYRELMPTHWKVRDIAKMSLLKQFLERFWNNL